MATDSGWKGLPDRDRSSPSDGVSAARQRANRANAQQSTGPRTVAGKAIASQNACRHGLLSRVVLLLPGEDLEEFTAFAEGFQRACEPDGAVEELCVSQLVAVAWRLRRVAPIEAGLLRRQMYAERLPWVPPDPADAIESADAFDALPRSAAAIRRFHRDRRVRSQAVKARDRALRVAERKRTHRENDLGHAFGAVEVDDGITKLSRYQTMLERSFRRTLRLLQDLQADRRRPSSASARMLDVPPVASADDPGHRGSLAPASAERETAAGREPATGVRPACARS